MKKSVTLGLAIIILSCNSFASEGSSGWYAGALFTYSEFSSRQHHRGGGILLGYSVNQFISAEARLTRGTRGYSRSYDEDQPFGQDYKEDINLQSSLLLKANYPVGDATNIYLLGGISTTEVTVQARGENLDSDGQAFGRFFDSYDVRSSGLTYGLGVDYLFSTGIAFFLEYQLFPEVDVSLPDAYTLPLSETLRRKKSFQALNFGVSYAF